MPGSGRPPQEPSAPPGVRFLSLRFGKFRGQPATVRRPPGSRRSSGQGTTDIKADGRINGAKCCAASNRPWPATISPSSVTITGAVEPYSTSEAGFWRSDRRSGCARSSRTASGARAATARSARAGNEARSWRNCAWAKTKSPRERRNGRPGGSCPGRSTGSRKPPGTNAKSLKLPNYETVPDWILAQLARFLGSR